MTWGELRRRAWNNQKLEKRNGKYSLSHGGERRASGKDGGGCGKRRGKHQKVADILSGNFFGGLKEARVARGRTTSAAGTDCGDGGELVTEGKVRGTEKGCKREGGGGDPSVQAYQVEDYRDQTVCRKCCQQKIEEKA